jgi:hypothetical protein
MVFFLKKIFVLWQWRMIPCMEVIIYSKYGLRNMALYVIHLYSIMFVDVNFLKIILIKNIQKIFRSTQLLKAKIIWKDAQWFGKMSMFIFVVLREPVANKIKYLSNKSDMIKWSI